MVHQALPAHLDLLVPRALPDEERKEQEVQPVSGESEEGEDFRDPLGLQGTALKDIDWVRVEHTFVGAVKRRPE